MDSVTRGSETLRYRYLPLGHREIRLLQKVKCPTEGTDFSYSIVHASLDDLPRYETISYVWGNSSLLHSISLIDGSTLSVTSSVARALPYVTQACKADYLWMDQLTINQADLIERNEQVQIMGEIYSRCARCLIWLEHAPMTETLALNSFELGRSRLAGQTIVETLRSFDNDESTTDLEHAIEARSYKGPKFPRESAFQGHLTWFLLHPWFERTWIYQEFVLAPEASFLIGDFEIPRETIDLMLGPGWGLSSEIWLGNLNQHLNVDNGPGNAIYQLAGMKFLLAAEKCRDRLARRQRQHIVQTAPWEGRFNAYESVTYADILKKMGRSKAHDDRDHVYAFVGLAPFLLKHLQVDYSLPVEEIFAAMVKALIRETKSLEFFAHLPTLFDTIVSKLQLPSWVPDWSAASESVEILCTGNLFNACGTGFGLPLVSKCKHMSSPSTMWNELEVAGKIIDTIESLLPFSSAYQSVHGPGVHSKSDLGGMPWQAATLESYMVKFEELGIERNDRINKNTLLRTLLMDGVRWAALAPMNSEEPLNHTGSHTLGKHHFEKTVELVDVLVEAETLPDAFPHDATLATLHELSKVQCQRNLVHCTGGCLAMVPNLAKAGDEIAILHGSRTPVILRTSPGGKHAVIGQCFYDGAMYGEMADMEDDAASIFTLA